MSKALTQSVNEERINGRDLLHTQPATNDTIARHLAVRPSVFFDILFFIATQRLMTVSLLRQCFNR
jgi:hypothetical protein